MTTSTPLDHPTPTARGIKARWVPRSDAASGGTLVDRVLASRGLGSDAEDFLVPKLTGLHDPSLIPDLDRAAERLLGALRAREAVVIYGDYDTDGVTAAAILYRVLRAIEPEAPVSVYIPHRVDEGYGINGDALRQIASEGARVVVSVDCGITAVGPASVARELGLDLIITDHHNPPASLDDLPDAYAVVHPRRPDSAYPFGDLCGAGVAYKLAWRLCTLVAGGDRAGDEHRKLLIDLLSLAALGAIADVVPLLGENRSIVRFGLGRMRGSPFVGLRALIAASRLDSDSVGADDVGFRLAPRLNAAGRLGHARESAELLTTDDAARAESIAAELCRVNDRRRRVEREIFEQACALAEDAGMTAPDRRAIVLAHEDWHTGVVGIVCSRLVERYCRPTLLLSREGALCKGSGRSIDGFNLHAALEGADDLLKSFGGHDMAAGLSLDTDNLDAFTERFIRTCNGALGEDDLVPTVRYDCEVSGDELGVDAVRGLERLAPFGRGNPRPAVLVRGLTLGETRPLGSSGEHLEFRVRDASAMLRIVAWGWAKTWSAYRNTIPAGAGIEVVVEPKISSWSGRVEGTLRDLRQG